MAHRGFHYRFWVSGICLACSLSTCLAEEPAAPPRFAGDVQAILARHCGHCHGPSVQKADLNLSTRASLLRGGESGPVVIPGDTTKSLLIKKIRDGEMPPDDADRLSDEQLELLVRWIDSGALGEPGSADDAAAVPTQHDVLPILLRRCAVCHGRHRQEGGLDLRTKASLLRGGRSGPAIALGKPEQSLLLKRVEAGDMPPADRLVEACVKPMEAHEVSLIGRWIAAGAPEVTIAPDVAGVEPDRLVTDAERQFWSFLPPRRAAVPMVSAESRQRIANPVDAFVVQRLQQAGLKLSPTADKRVLARRVALDLTGLPLDPAEVEAFVNDQNPDAYDRLVDRLLESPRYGERWARFWLDLAGYADSEGKREQDLPREYAWRYRDYVIQSFNNDKPYDRFLLEQLAGDELADYEHAPRITQEIYDNLVATGFLKMAPDASWANITGYLHDRVEIIADEMEILSAGVMGLTFKCARCHSHKFDPIPQRDYYRLLDVFKGALDEHDWLKPEIRPGIGPVSVDFLPGRLLPYVTDEERIAWESREAQISAEITKLTADLDAEEQRRVAAYRDEQLAALSSADRVLAETLLKLPADQRSETQRKALQQWKLDPAPDRCRLKQMYGEFKTQVEQVEQSIAAAIRRRQPRPLIQAVWDRGEPTPTYVYRRGDPLSLGALVGPGVPSALTDGRTPFVATPPWPGAKSTGRRLAFARWLTRPDHPLTARVVVNRIWQQHFGKGIVTTLGNFGHTGAPPTHPELLDWLAVEFMEHGWRFKALQRLLVTSATYQQSSEISAAHQERDPDNRLYSRMPLQRLDAEQLYDGLLALAGQLDETPGGPGDRLSARPDGLITPLPTERGWRRLIYVRQYRKQLATHLETFDFPAMNPHCLERRQSQVAPQALHLFNNGMVAGLAADFAHRVQRDGGRSPADKINFAYRLAFGRPPSDEERQFGLRSVEGLIRAWQQGPSDGSENKVEQAERHAWETFCHALVNAAEFLFVD